MVHCSISIRGICQLLTGLSSTQTGLNGEHAVIHKLLRFYTFKMSVDIAVLPELLFSLPQTVIFYLFIVSRCRPGFIFSLNSELNFILETCFFFQANSNLANQAKSLKWKICNATLVSHFKKRDNFPQCRREFFKSQSGAVSLIHDHHVSFIEINNVP